MSTRKIKAQVLTLLKDDAPWSEFEALDRAGLINGLQASLSRPEEEVRARGAKALGRAVAEMAGQAGGELEPARNIMRRLVWSLNDESGAVGWGAAEAMAEIMLRLPALAPEFSAVLVFQLRDDPGAPDFPPLVKSALRAVGRIAKADPAHAAGTAQHLPRFLASPDPEIRGLAAWVAGLAGEDSCLKELENLVQDQAPFNPPQEDGAGALSVGQAAREALDRLKRR